MKLLTAKQAATVLAVSLSKIYALKDAGKIPFYPIDGCIRFAEEDLLDYLSSVRVETQQVRNPQRRNLREMFR